MIDPRVAALERGSTWCSAESLRSLLCRALTRPPGFLRALAVELIGAVEAHVEANHDGGNDSEQEGRRAGDADGEKPDPDKAPRQMPQTRDVKPGLKAGGAGEGHKPTLVSRAATCAITSGGCKP